MYYDLGNDSLKELQGKTITAIYIDDDEQHYIKFETDDGEALILEAFGDCCSESWFYHVLGFDAPIGHQVKEVIEVDMGEINDDLTRQDYDILYSLKFVTDGGYADIEFRNSSNGYYGGWVAEVSSIPQDVNMIRLTGNYSAS